MGSRSTFRGVQSLPAGHLLTLENGRESVRCYWDWTFPQGPDYSRVSLEEAAEQLRELLIDAVRLQLRSDVPVGAYLSGGLDSSGIVSLIRNHTSAPLRTFSVAFEDSEFDESRFQREMVATLGTDHTTLKCTQADIGKIFPSLIRHTETPILRTAPAPLMLLSGDVRRAGYKVVLTGEGADEVFGGYDLFKEAALRRFWAPQPGSRWRSLLFSRLYPYLRNSPVANQAFARSFFGQRLDETSSPFYAHFTRWSTTQGIWKFFSPAARAALAAVSPEKDLAERLPAAFTGWNPLGRDQYIEVHTLLEGYLLSSQGDRVAMANSVEGRVPYLDHRVIEFANRLSPRLKLRGLREKVVLRRALAGMLPASIVQRVKQPYRAPDSQSFFEGGRPLPYVADLLNRERLREAGYFDADAIQGLVAKCAAGRASGAGDNMALVGVLSTMLVHEQFVTSRP
jgi:asparagine synthase (glutamine-hydrolysing)